MFESIDSIGASEGNGQARFIQTDNSEGIVSKTSLGKEASLTV